MKDQWKEYCRRTISRLWSWMICRRRFGKLHRRTTYPYIGMFCQFKHTRSIEVGSDVRFMRGVTILADKDNVIRIGDNSTICRFTIIQSVGGIISIGKHCTIGDFCNLFGQGGLSIGDNVLIASGARIVPNEHTFDDLETLIRLQPCRSLGINISDNVWIGTNVTILDGVTIGHGVVVGAGSVVTRDIPNYAIAVGVPARVIKYRPGYDPEQACKQ